jgi:carboxymethylenebutenolidase
MGQVVRLVASDHHALDTYRSDPIGKSKGGIVVIQEAFGVNEHIRAVCDDFAARGYAAAAPAIYDRQQRNATFAYDEEPAKRARAMRARIKYDEVLLDVAAAIESLRPQGRVGIVGFCVGGSAAWLAACKLKVDAVACYYPSDIGKQADEQPRCPAIMHFAERDHIIHGSDVETLRAAHETLPIYIYPAEHGFNNWHRPATFDEASAKLALERTLALFETYLAG